MAYVHGKQKRSFMNAEYVKSSVPFCLRSLEARLYFYFNPLLRTPNTSLSGKSSIEPVMTTFWESCKTLLESPRFEQVKTIKQWFLPIYKKFLARCASSLTFFNHPDLVSLVVTGNRLKSTQSS